MECTERKKKRAGGLRGSAVVEMSYIIPLFLGLFVLIVHTVFYYHDKAVMNAAAAETAVLGAQASRREGTDYDLEAFFGDRTDGKLIYMTDAEVSVSQTTGRSQSARRRRRASWSCPCARRRGSQSRRKNLRITAEVG